MISAYKDKRRLRRVELQCFMAFFFTWTAVSFIPPSRNASLLRRQALLPKKSSCLFVRDKKNLSSSERERRDEENRRKLRKDDVVIGETSAKKGEKDFALNPKATEEDWLRQASNVDQEIFRLTEFGMDSLNSLKLEEADSAFDKVFELRPNAYLWQAGIVKFYLGDLHNAADVFARNAETFETKFGGPASEERIWRDACELKYLNMMSKQERKKLETGSETSTLLRVIPENESDDLFSIESRMVIKTTRDLFSASVGSDISGELLARAKLRSMGGSKKDMTGFDRKMWRLNSWFYLGLHYDALGDSEESKRCMKMALKLCPSSGKSDDIVHTLPLLHMSVRDWFDDDDFEQDPLEKSMDETEDPGFTPEKPSFVSSMAYADPVIEASIMEGVGKMRLSELKEALRLRGLKVVGSKESLQERLFFSLMDDAGFNSGFAP